jgi:class 3 adenylate cyclase
MADPDVVVAARIGSLAGADEILVSAEVADRLGTHVRVLRRAATSLKGIPEAVEVATVVWH